MIGTPVLNLYELQKSAMKLEYCDVPFAYHDFQKEALYGALSSIDILTWEKDLTLRSLVKCLYTALAFIGLSSGWC